jgi:hypothetical protein
LTDNFLFHDLFVVADVTGDAVDAVIIVVASGCAFK